MTIGGWDLNCIARGATYLGGMIVEYSTQTPKVDAQPNNIPLDKRVESISTSILIAMLAMKPPLTRIRIHENIIIFEEYSNKSRADRTYALYVKNDTSASKKVFLDYEIFERMTKCHHWYPIGSEGAQTIARIHAITLKGMEKIKKTYEDTYVPDHVKKYQKDIEEFIEKNKPSKETSQDEASPKSAELKEAKSKLTDLMQQVYSDKEITTFAARLETAWELFESGSELEKNQIPELLDGIEKDLKTKVKFYLQLMKKDAHGRY
ncbi:MAG: hypothetical protein AAGG81_07595 [Chlamydiota bacterium]